MFKIGDKIICKRPEDINWYKEGNTFTTRGQPFYDDENVLCVHVEEERSDHAYVQCDQFDLVDKWDGAKVQSSLGTFYTVKKFETGYYLEWVSSLTGQLVNNIENYNCYDQESMQSYLDDGTWKIVKDDAVCLEDNINITSEKDSDGYAVDHYNNFYKLTEKDIEAGEIKVDAYWVAKQWKTGSRDDSGALWHSLKTIARFGDKNCKAREIKALYNQAIALARIYEVDLNE